MGGRSRSTPAPTETKVTQSNLPEYVQPYFERLLQRGEAESNQPYTPYGGERIAYFSPDELASQGMTRGYAQAGTPPEYQIASNRAMMMGGPYGSGYQAGMFDPGYQAGMIGQGYQSRNFGPRFDTLDYESNINRFMNPYQQNVTDIAKREAIRASEMMGDKSSDAATRVGGLGGYREGIIQAERERNLAQQLSDIQTKGSLGAYQSAQQQLAAERQAQLTGQKLNLQQYMAEEQSRQRETQLQTQRYQAAESARQQAAKLGLTAQQQEEAARQAQEKFDQSAYDMSQRFGLASIDALRNVGGDIQSDVRERIAALGGIGQQQRAMQQAALDMGYQDFLRQQGYGQQQLGFLGGLLQGIPIAPQEQISTYQQQPGLFQTAVGAGLSGLGLYRGLS